MSHLQLSTQAIVATSLLVLLWTIESAWPMFIGRRRRGKHYAANIALGLLNAGVMAIIFGGVLLYVTERAHSANIGLLRWLSPPTAVQWILAIALFDAWQYAFHVMHHKVPLLWRFHSVHHNDAEMDASSAFRFHVGEIALGGATRMVVLPLLGMSMVHLAAYELLVVPISLFHHSNMRLPARVDRFLRCFIVTPWMHWVHHSTYQPETDSNYASIFSIWDRIFGTFQLLPDPASIRLGLDDFEEREWRDLRGMLLSPFTHRFKRSTNAASYRERGVLTRLFRFRPKRS